jgi:Ca-activated chloride channel homolog
MDPADLALVIAVDGSASVTFDEFNLIAGGLAAAFREQAVVTGLLGGPRHASLCALLLWSGSGAHEVMIEWTLLAKPEDVAGFADQLENVPRTVKAGATAIGEALIECVRLLEAAPAKSTRQIVDVAGDGRSNDGVPPGPVRDRMAAAGITINGLCVLHEEPDLLASYEREVIGGPGAFALTCANYAEFAEAMRRKLLREMSNKPVA